MIKIERIQNLWQWERYTFQKERLSRKSLTKDVNEMWLFHGTRKNEPPLIYKGEDGFDMRYGEAGMWGRASYFAQNASYSDTYAFKTDAGTKQFFHARVAVGKVVEKDADGCIKKPPEGFDSVTGTTSGSKVCIFFFVVVTTTHLPLRVGRKKKIDSLAL